MPQWSPMFRDLHECGEYETANWILTCSDDELVKVCSVAEWLLYFGPSRPSGGSLMIARACALLSCMCGRGHQGIWLALGANESRIRRQCHHPVADRTTPFR
jgi:hypothetical protein